MKLEDVCIFDVASCTPEISLTEAARLMRKHHSGDLIVVDNADEDREPVGVITDRDIVIEAVAQGKNPDQTKVRDIMSKRVVVASASEDLSAAIDRMRTHGVRRIPVLDDERRVIGVVSLDDVMRLHAEQAAAILEVVTKQQQREKRTRR